jgi:TatD DNase family protein
MILVDSHAHLDAPQFKDDLGQVLARAERESVGAILTIGCLNQESDTVDRFLRLLESKSYFFGAAGIHPHDARLFDAELETKCRRLCEHPKVIGWGEIGLDYYYNHSSKERQRQAFRKQIRLAKSLEKPIIVHMRDAETETLRILGEEYAEGSSENSGIMHCFNSSSEVAERCIAMGFLISFGGILTFKKSDELRATASRLPEDCLLVETDAPYLAPVPYRGKRNEPAYVKRVAEQLASLRGREFEEIAQITTANFLRLFNLRQVKVQ